MPKGTFAGFPLLSVAGWRITTKGANHWGTAMSANTYLRIKLAKNATDAMQKGYFYRPPVYKPIKVLHALVIADGTENGKPTVDFVLEAEDGRSMCL